VKGLKILAVAAVVLLVGTVGAMADARDELVKVQLPGGSEGQLYSRSSLIPEPEIAPPLPTPVDPVPAPMDIAKTGPTANPVMFSTMSSDTAGAVLVAPRGGAMSSPKARADRQIRLLIRRLD
jgi:hypothetical protein